MKSRLLAVAAIVLAATAAHAQSDELLILGAMPDADVGATWGKKTQMASATIRPAQRAVTLQKQVVDFDRAMAPGSILVRTSERRLYLVMPGGKALMFPIGVGKEGFTWSGTNRISRKAMWPDWRPPKVMIRREAAKGRVIPAFMQGGPKNPLGARALYIGSTEFRIHGTTQPWSIGRAVSSGCIRLLNEHVIDLYDQVKVGALVVVE